MAKPARNRTRVAAPTVFFRLRRKELTQRAHTLLLQEQQRWGGVPPHLADWHYDVRRGRLRFYGALLRFIDCAVERGTPEDVLQQIPQWLAWFITDACIERDRRRRDARLTLMSDS